MKSILLVEDDPFLVDIYSTKFKQAGFEVRVASDGDEALREIEKRRPHIIVLDIVLPTVDGWEVLEKIRAKEELRMIPVVILSNLEEKSAVEKATKLGVIKYLIKSRFTPSQVVREIVKVIG